MKYSLRPFQFGLLALFATVTVAAVAFAIVRLPVAWVFKLGVLWGFLICVVGFTLRNHNPKAPKP
jgi:hypothetical protein